LFFTRRHNVIRLSPSKKIKKLSFFVISFKHSFHGHYFFVSIKNKRTIFMQDGARPHSGKIPLTWLEQNKVTWIRDWPANSPDLNPIEEIWKEVNRELAERGIPQSTAEIKRMVEGIWEDYPMSKVNNHVMSFMSKCKTCVKNRGGMSH
jgi:hypothetical protein